MKRLEQAELFGAVVPRFPRSRRPGRPTATLAVLRAIRAAGVMGLTTDEVQVVVRLTHQTASARVHELERAGKIRATGTRPTRSGRSAQIWVEVCRCGAAGVHEVCE